MQETMSRAVRTNAEDGSEDVFIVLCASGFDNISRVRSALMFASLAAVAHYRTILYCIQDAVDVMVRGAIERSETQLPGAPSIAQRLREAMATGVEIQCCTQTMANKKISAEDLLEGIKPAGAMNLIALTSGARGALCF